MALFIYDDANVKLYVTVVISSLFGFFLLLVFIRIYNYCTMKMCHSSATLKGKTVIITGANSGIGKETAKELATREARVIMACRNLQTANQIKDEIVKETNNTNVVVRYLDLSSMQSVRKFAAKINQTESRLDILIHNAGMANAFKKRVTEEGLEETMATNQYGPFLLTLVLCNLLKKSAPSRIVIVASELYRLARLDLSNANPVHGFPGYLYYVSKYANIVFTLELARRLQGTGVTANCLHPGLIDSGIWRNVPFPLNLPLKLIAKMCFKTTKEGAQTTIFAAISQKLQCTTGKYFAECEEAKLTDTIQNELVGKKYWEICENLVQLKFGESHL